MECHMCTYSCSIPGNVHLSCKHPVLKGVDIIVADLVSRNIIINIKTFKITFNSHGVKNGWCNWPINFDPCWIEGECKMFKEK